MSDLLSCTCWVRGVGKESECIVVYEKSASSDLPCQCDCHQEERNRIGYFRTAPRSQYIRDGKLFVRPPDQW